MKNTTPVYTKWTSSDAVPSSSRLAVPAAEPTPPPPFPEYHQEENRTVGPPSGSGDSMSAGGYFSIPLGTKEETLYGTCSLFLGVDDWGYMSVKDSSGRTVAEVDLRFDSQKAGKQGGYGYHGDVGGAQLPSGEYTWTVEQTNIDYIPASGNVSICNYKIDVVPTEAGGIKDPEPCSCEGNTCNSDGGAPPAPYSLMSLSVKSADAQGAFSSAGCSVQTASTEKAMYWSCHFGTFRGLGGIPAGFVKLRAEDGVLGLQKPSALTYNHPLTSYLKVPEGGIVAGSRFDLMQGDRVIAMRCDANGVDVRTVGVDTQGGGKASMITVSGQSCLQWAVADGSMYTFVAKTGKLLSYTSADKQTIDDASVYLDVKRLADGSLGQIWNLWDGLLNIESVTSRGYTLALYTPAQVTGRDASGLYTVAGAPFKTFEMSLSDATHFSVTEKTPQRLDYTVTWWKAGKAWNMQRGTGEEALVTTRTRKELEANVWQIVVEESKGVLHPVVASRVCEVYQTTNVGDLLLSRVTAYGSDIAQTTQYLYDQCGRLKEEIAPDASVRSWSYDEYGRLLSYNEPWAEQGRRNTIYSYLNSSASAFNSDLETESVRLLPFDGKEAILSTKAYKYTIENHIKRTEKRVTGLGVTGTRLSIDEQWQATAPNPYARGRSHMTQAVDGTQLWYDYATATQHGALYTETEKTRIDGTAVPSKSTRKLTYITASGQRIREESFVLLSDNTWILTESADYTFDTQNRWIKKTRGNGRITERSLMCDGGILWEKDEDGVITQHAYDSARQHIESIRSETASTPETIHSYVLDAQGQTLQTRIDIGAMSTVESSAYDLLGRLLSSTDLLGRVTSYAYSADGLTVTQTTPSSATLITRRAPDGTVMETSGTGQRHTRTLIYLIADGILSVTNALVENAEIEVQRSVVNGIGESLRAGTSNTSGGTLFHRRWYNARGQVTKEQTDGGNAATTMAPTLYEYDSFGNKSKETWQLDASPTIANSRIATWTYGVEAAEDGVYRIVTSTQNNAQGGTYTTTSKQLISALSSLLESKSISIDPRGKQRTQWTEYAGATIRNAKSTSPTSIFTAQSRSVDGWVTNSSDFAGVSTTASRAYTATGITIRETDGRQNTTITKTDLAERTISVTDAAGNSTTSAYHPHFDLPILITNALGKTSAYQYDIRGRKTAEYGTALQPLLFAYNEANQMTRLTSFRATEGDISSDPTSRTDGDSTTWSYDEASQMLMKKTYADGTHEDSTYNALNMIESFTDARGITRSYSYDLKRGVNTAQNYSDGTAGIQLSWNLLNQLTEIRDASGTRIIAYNQYAETETESISIEGKSYQLTEERDIYARSEGYRLARDTDTIMDVRQSYSPEGRLAKAGIIHGGSEQNYSYGYLPGSHLLSSLSMPTGIVKTQSYEAQRDLLTSISYKQSSTETDTLVTRSQSYDALGRPITRTQQRGTEATREDQFSYNDRNELIATILGTDHYGYDYDNIGNRKTAEELTQELNYQANMLNQYTSITSVGTPSPFIPEFDLAGNQTKIQTATGIWTLIYNAENRPLSFTSADGQNRIDCDYDYQGRRYMKKVSIQGSVISHERYLYRGYLQIAALDMLNSQALIRRILWDPKEPSATRPLALLQDWKLYSYGHDFLKNVTELFDETSQITTTYDYSPYGAVTETSTTDTNTNNITQPYQWSSEIADPELALSYYNYRHYNPTDGRWINRDPIQEQETVNLYRFVENNIFLWFDVLGNGAQPITGGPASGNGNISTYTPKQASENSSPVESTRRSSPRDSTSFLPGMSPGIALPPSAYTSKNPCQNCPKDAPKVRLKNSQCCEYRTNQQKPKHKPASNGCGPESFPVPDSLMFNGIIVSFLSACNAHDICYDTCGSNQWACDKLFGKLLIETCFKTTMSENETPNEGAFAECLFVANIYSGTVIGIGFALNQFNRSSAYHKAQDEACEWKTCKKI